MLRITVFPPACTISAWGHGALGPLLNWRNSSTPCNTIFGVRVHGVRLSVRQTDRRTERPWQYNVHFAKCYGWGTTRECGLKIGFFVPTVSVWSKISGHPTKRSSCQKTRMNGLSCGRAIRMLAQVCFLFCHKARVWQTVDTLLMFKVKGQRSQSQRVFTGQMTQPLTNSVNAPKEHTKLN